MPKQVAKSQLNLDAGFMGSVSAHKTDETKLPTGGKLPAGIENGVAELVEMKIDKHKDGTNKGKPFFHASGVVKEPLNVGNIKVEGKRTSIVAEPLYDTPTRSRKTRDEHIAWMLNVMRMIGGENCLAGVNTEAELIGVMDALKTQGLHFSFRTWQGSKQEIVKEGGKFKVGDKVYATEQIAKAANPFAGRDPMVNEEWGKACEYTPGESPDPVNDATGSTQAPDESSSDASAPAEDVPFGDDLDMLGDKANTDEESGTKLLDIAEGLGLNRKEMEVADSWDIVVAAIREAQAAGGSAAAGDGIDYDALGAAADESDDAAIDKLTELANGNGLDPNDPNVSWSELAEKLKELAGGSGDNAASACPWEVGNTAQIKMIGPDGKPVLDKKKKPRLQDVEIIAVQESDETVHVKSLDDKKTILGRNKKPLPIKFADLITQ